MTKPAVGCADNETDDNGVTVASSAAGHSCLCVCGCARLLDVTAWLYTGKLWMVFVISCCYWHRTSLSLVYRWSRMR